jgi:hypothetical protein
MSSVVEQLDAQARQTIQPVNANVSCKEYFQQGASYLKEAGARKKNGDVKGAYLYLMMYFVLIMERIPTHPYVSQCNDEYYYNCERCAGVISTELRTLRETLTPPKQSSSSSGGWFSSWGSSSSSSSKTTTPTSPPPQQQQVVPVSRNLPPTPTKQYGPPMTMQERAVATVVMNEQVQESVGRGVANMANNEQVQAKVANGVANAAHDRKYQQMVGSTIAQNSDNKLVQSLATNETVQRHMGTVIANTAGNKEVQKKVGTAIASAATNKEVQRKVANGLLGAAKLGWSATKTGASLAVRKY